MSNTLIKLKQNFLFIIGAFILLMWLAFLSLRTFFSFNNISVVCLITQICLIDIVNLILVHKIYNKADIASKKIGKWLLLSIYAFLIVDIVYFLVYSVPHQSQLEHLFNTVHVFYYIMTIVFFMSILLKSKLKTRQFLSILMLTIILSLIILTIFSVDTSQLIDKETLRIKIDNIQSIVDLILFSLAFLWLIYSGNTGASFIASGYIICSSSEFMMTSCYMTRILYLLDWAQLTWILGLILIMLGMILIVHKKNYNIKEWIANDATIKTKLTFLTFAAIAIILIMFFILLKEFSVINKTFFIFFPTIMMDFTLVIALFSITIGKAIDKPLLQIQNDIERSFLNKQTNITENQLMLDDSHRYSEIQRIEMHIKSLISYVNKQSKDAAIGILAKKVAHNIKFPLIVLQDCKNKLKSYIEVDEKLIKDLSVSIDNIKYTLITLLNLNSEQKFQTQEDSENPRYILLKPLIDQIINQKTIELHNRCELVYTDNIPEDNIWIYTFPFNLINSISNLLNNSFEAFKSTITGKIELNLSINENAIIINIKDNGCGIEKNILDKVTQGYSTKSSGQGIGLSTAIKYFNSIGGKLEIISTSPFGTSIDITIPNTTAPSWLPANVHILDYIVILDDATSVHTYLKTVFRGKTTVKYFTKISDFKQWAKENGAILNDVTYFIDNQLDDSNEHGIDLIKSYNIMHTSYLTTNEYDNQLLQETAAQFHIRIIPKPLIKTFLPIS